MPYKDEKDINASDVNLEGLADIENMQSLKDLSEKHNVTVDFLKEQLEMGIKVEQEHTEDKSIAEQISMDHLTEFPNYYIKLEKMEEDMENKISKELVKLAKELVGEVMFDDYRNWMKIVGRIDLDLEKLLKLSKSIGLSNKGLKLIKEADRKLIDAHEVIQEEKERGIENLHYSSESKVAFLSWKKLKGKPNNGHRLPPNTEDVEVIEPKDTDLTVYRYIDSRGKLCGLAYIGRSKKPAWHYTYRSEHELDDKVEKTEKIRLDYFSEKKKRRDERSQFKHDLVVGDILDSNWGYGQTNIDFFEVIATTAKSVIIRQIAKKIVKQNNNDFSNSVMPIEGKFTGKKMTKRVNPRGYVKIESYQIAEKWDGRPKSETMTGYGH